MCLTSVIYPNRDYSAVKELSYVEKYGHYRPTGWIPAGESCCRAACQRPDVTLYAQSSYETLFAPADFAGLTLGERLLAALRVAALEASQPLIAHYRPRFNNPGQRQRSSLHLKVIEISQHFRHVRQQSYAMPIFCTPAPASAAPEHLAALQAAGLSTRNIVTLAQLIIPAFRCGQLPRWHSSASSIRRSRQLRTLHAATTRRKTPAPCNRNSHSTAWAGMPGSTR